VNEIDVPTAPYGATEVAPAPFNTVVVPENRPETNPRPEAWNPPCPDYPWWKLNFTRKPEPTGDRLTEIYLLAWIKEITRKHADDWLDIETSRADLEKQLTNLRKTSEVRG
jgi:hypothetical protein